MTNLGYERVDARMKCEGAWKHKTLEEATKICDQLEENCEGIEDKFCNGTVIATCLKIIPSTTSSGEGCFYVRHEMHDGPFPNLKLF